jgi:hypothetical protein
LPTV